MTTTPPEATPAVEQIAAKLAASDGLDWHEVCAYERDEDPEDGCDSGTCVAAYYEDHDPDIARQNYRKWARIAFDEALRHRREATAQAGEGGEPVTVQPVHPVNGARDYWIVKVGPHRIEFQDRNEFAYGDGKERADAFAAYLNAHPPTALEQQS